MEVVKDVPGDVLDGSLQGQQQLLFLCLPLRGAPRAASALLGKLLVQQEGRSGFSPHGPYMLSVFIEMEMNC